MPSNYRFTGKPADRALMFCPVGFKSSGNAAMVNAIGAWGEGTFDSAKEYSNNPPGVATHVFINIAVSAAEKAEILTTDFGSVTSYFQSDGWTEDNAASDMGIELVVP